MTEELISEYDEAADVLHVSFASLNAVYGEPLEGFDRSIIILRDADTNDVIGFRVLGAKGLKNEEEKEPGKSI